MDKCKFDIKTSKRNPLRKNINVKLIGINTKDNINLIQFRLIVNLVEHTFISKLNSNFNLK